jgi:hypothetical protein
VKQVGMILDFLARHVSGVRAAATV